MTREPFIAHSELTNEIYIVAGKEKYRVTEQAIKAVMAIKAIEQEPTTKNDLGVDREQLKAMIRGLTKWYVKRDNTEVGEPNTAVGLLYDDVMFGIDRLPSVTPQEPKILPIAEIKYAEAAAGVWIDIHDRLPDRENKFVLCCFENGYVDTCTIGYLLENERITAWMPLPEPYKR